MDGFIKSLGPYSESLAQTAANVVTHIDNDARQQTLKKLRDCLETFCNNVDKQKNINDVTKETASIEDGNKEEIIAQWMQNIESYEAVSSDSEYLKEYDKRVASLLKNADQSQDSHDDEDLLVAQGQNVNVVCPISKCRMTEPMKNTICGHVYDKTSVISLLNVNKNVRCPMLGCNNKQYLSMDDLQADLVTKMNIETDSM